ncbi:MAG: Uma2 family endonuclease [Calothrix sp. CSU_2_0]|nr:Uma2 family endonuclease [Calothrix sp. CSU_2_0]
MVNFLPTITTLPTDTWVETTWEDFTAFADDPTLVNAKFYYDEGWMRVEMSALGSAHGQDNSIISTLVILYAIAKNIPLKELTNTSFRKRKIRESQPDIAFYIGENLKFPPRNNSPVNLDEIDPPTLVIEIAASSLEDDSERKLKLYQRLGVQEYWVVDVNNSKVSANYLSKTENTLIRTSQVLPGLEMDVVEQALLRSQTEDDVSVSRWLMSKFNQTL